jgi:hypothetical protein
MSLLLFIAKVFISSGILFGYYWLFLRNKRFHHYNRFYLIAALLLPPVISLINIPVFHQPGNAANGVLYQTVTILSIEPRVANPGQPAETLNAGFGWQQLLYCLYGLVSLVLLIILARALFYIRRLRRNYPYKTIRELKLYNTTEPGTPFSFFQSIFWNNELVIDSKEGQQIFRHELFHVQQKHSLDIMVAEIMTVIFWINPFFHLIKKELKAIHEFLADQYAINNNDRSEYAALLIQRILASRSLSVNNYFFQNHIKRRIAMITQLKSKKVGYWSRLMVLPIAIVLFCGIALYAGQTPESNQRNRRSRERQTERVILDKSIADTVSPELRRKLEKQLMELESEKQQLLKQNQDKLQRLLIEQDQVLRQLQEKKQMQLDRVTEEAVQKIIEKEKGKLGEEKKFQVELDAIKSKTIRDQHNDEELQKKILELQQKVIPDQMDKLVELEKSKQLELLKKQVADEANAQNKLLLDLHLQEEKQKVFDKQSKLLLDEKLKGYRGEQELLKKKLHDYKDKSKDIYVELQDYRAVNDLVRAEDSVASQLIRQISRRVRYPEQLIRANYEGSVFASIDINASGEATDYVIHKQQPGEEAPMIYEIVVVGYKPSPNAKADALEEVVVVGRASGSKSPSPQDSNRAILNSEVEKVISRLAPLRNGNHKAARYYFKITFQIGE